MANCVLCSKELKFMNTPVFGAGKLSDGGTVCLFCFRKINNVNPQVAFKLKKYTLDAIKNMLQEELAPIAKSTTEVSTIDINKAVENAIFKKYGNEEGNIVINDLTREQRHELLRGKTVLSKGIDFMQIESKTIQALESMQLIENSPNPDTVIGRFNFVWDLMNSLSEFPKNGRYISALQTGIDRYKTMYYDRIVNASHVNYLMNVNELMGEYEKHYRKCLVESFERYLDKHEDQIKELKKQSAIESRFIKINEVMFMVENEVPKHYLNESVVRISQMKTKYLVSI